MPAVLLSDLNSVCRSAPHEADDLLSSDHLDDPSGKADAMVSFGCAILDRDGY